MKKILIFVMTAVLLISSTQGAFATENKDIQDPLVIVLDPGHDKTHGGARANELSETALNLKIAQYCYEELCTYSNVEVYMTRNTSECPHPETCGKTDGARMDNLKRVDFAKHLGADAYVALHLNSYNDSSINGAMVFVPNNNYRPQIGKEGNALGYAIYKELLALGLKDQGISIRGSEDGTHYEDGSLADYYGVIKRAKDADIPGIIVEHCFISSPHDVSYYLGTEAQLKALGVADATGIAKYYGLEKTGKTISPDKIHKVEFVKDGKLVYTEYVRHGQDAWALDEEMISAVNITYRGSLSNITKDTTITVNYDPVDFIAPEPDTETESESEDSEMKDSETENDGTTETETVVPIETEEDTETEDSTISENTEIMNNPNNDGQNSLQDVLKYAAGLIVGLAVGYLIGFSMKKKKNISKEE